MGGMLVLEYAYLGKEYVRTIVPIATSSRHSAWGISWGEVQRQDIYNDPKYEDGYYSFDDPPSAGLGAARMTALLTYRSRDSFESRFGRNVPDPSRSQDIGTNTDRASNEHWAVHNEGHHSTGISQPPSTNGDVSHSSVSQAAASNITVNSDALQLTDPQFHGAKTLEPPMLPTERKRGPTYFSAQSYLRYQRQKFVQRFDSNCYIAITRKLDTHDISRDRVPPNTRNHVAIALSQIQQPALVLGIESDALFTFAEQQEIAASIPNARLRNIDSPEGHDAFLLQFEQVNRHIIEFLRKFLPDIMNTRGTTPDSTSKDGAGALTKSSTFGEAEVEDITAW